MNAALPGWYGKLPALGDFASRRLDPAFIELWDGWLAEGMQALRERDPAAWLDAYLISPSWRFLLTPGCLPGVLGAHAWAGVLMPSVDRVGRYFPFTMVRSVQHLPLSMHGMQTLWQDLGRLDDLAADALQEDWGLERLEAELAAASTLSQPSPLVPAAHLLLKPGELITLQGEFDGFNHIVGEALQLWGAQSSACSYWYAAAAQPRAQALICKGLPRSSSGLLSLPPDTPAA